jgi:myo-inositol-1(or 4)-monophosphatase
MEELMPACAGLRRPGAAALDLCYVAAGWYDGFFETGLSPWDIAAGSLMITEAGGLVGNFTGEPDYLYQREIVAGSPRIYGQLVKTLTPYTRVIKEEDVAAPAAQGEQEVVLQALKSARGGRRTAPVATSIDGSDGVDAAEGGEGAEGAEAASAEPVPPKRTRITAAAKAAEVAAQPPERPARPRRNRDDAPF